MLKEPLCPICQKEITSGSIDQGFCCGTWFDINIVVTPAISGMGRFNRPTPLIVDTPQTTIEEIE